METNLGSEDYFNYKCNAKSEFESAIFLSKCMLFLPNIFWTSSLLIQFRGAISSTLPLINIIGINNYGKNIMLAFAMLSNETKESYTRLFSQLKTAWAKSSHLILLLTDASQ